MQVGEQILFLIYKAASADAFVHSVALVEF